MAPLHGGPCVAWATVEKQRDWILLVLDTKPGFQVLALIGDSVLESQLGTGLQRGK